MLTYKEIKALKNNRECLLEAWDIAIRENYLTTDLADSFQNQIDEIDKKLKTDREEKIRKANKEEKIFIFKILIFGILSISFLNALVNMWSEKRVIAAFAELFVTNLFHLSILILPVFVWYYTARLIYNKTKKGFIALPLSLAVAFCFGIILMNVSRKIPGVGWRINKMFQDPEETYDEDIRNDYKYETRNTSRRYRPTRSRITRTRSVYIPPKSPPKKLDFSFILDADVSDPKTWKLSKKLSAFDKKIIDLIFRKNTPDKIVKQKIENLKKYYDLSDAELGIRHEGTIAGSK